MSSQRKRFVTSSSNKHLEHGLGLWRAVNDPNSIEVRSMPSRVRRWCNRLGLAVQMLVQRKIIYDSSCFAEVPLHILGGSWRSRYLELGCSW
jgi:hypothetical protein